MKEALLASFAERFPARSAGPWCPWLGEVDGFHVLSLELHQRRWIGRKQRSSKNPSDPLGRVFRVRIPIHLDHFFVQSGCHERH